MAQAIVTGQANSAFTRNLGKVGRFVISTQSCGAKRRCANRWAQRYFAT